MYDEKMLVMPKTNKNKKGAVLPEMSKRQEGTKSNSVNTGDIPQRVSMDLVSEYVHEGAWKHVKSILFERINLVNSIETLDVTQPRELLMREVEARAHAIALIRQWIHDVEGMVDNHRASLDNIEEEVWYNVR